MATALLRKVILFIFTSIQERSLSTYCQPAQDPTQGRRGRRRESSKLREGFLASALLPAPRLLLQLAHVLQQNLHL